MQVPDIAIEIDYGLAIKPQDHTEHAVRRRVLRPMLSTISDYRAASL